MISRRRVIAAAAGAAVSGIVGSQQEAAATTRKPSTKKKSVKESKVLVEKAIPNQLNELVLNPNNKQIVFYSPHPDDELLSFGPIASEYIALGYELIYVLLTSGSSTSAIKLINGEVTAPGDANRFVFRGKHDPAVSGYAPLTVPDVGKARIIEFRSAAGEMQVKPSNVYVHDLLVEDELPVESAVAVMNEMVSIYPNAIHWSMSTIDIHRHHRAAGEALRQATVATSIKTGFALSRPTWPQIEKQKSFNNPEIPETFFFKPLSDRVQRLRNAALPYFAWNPIAGSFAIGYSSVPKQFDDLDNLGNAQYSVTAPPVQSSTTWITSS
jgi:LmbE family N-acetylglucosaminyl deacetylase